MLLTEVTLGIHGGKEDEVESVFCGQPPNGWVKLTESEVAGRRTASLPILIGYKKLANVLIQ